MIIRCPYCDSDLGVADARVRLRHHPDGSHTVIPWDPPPPTDEPTGDQP